MNQQIDMAFVDALERQKAKEQPEQERPRVSIEELNRPICDKVGHKVLDGTKRCIYCGSPA